MVLIGESPCSFDVSIIACRLYYKSDLIGNLQELFVLSNCTYIIPFFEENFNRGKEPTTIFVETFLSHKINLAPVLKVFFAYFDRLFSSLFFV